MRAHRMIEIRDGARIALRIESDQEGGIMLTDPESGLSFSVPADVWDKICAPGFESADVEGDL